MTTSILLLLTCSFEGMPAARAEASKPNVVLIMCDDLGWGDVGFNGNKIIKTPHLDEMASAGMKFTRFYAASAVCSPTRGSVVTGRHPFRYGIPHANQGHMEPAEITLAELLKAQGYSTGHFGKWHLGTLSKTIKESNRGGPKGEKHFSPPWQHGFDVCFSTEAKVPTYDPMLKPKKGASGKGWDYITDKNDAEAYGTHYWNEKGEMIKDNLDGDDSRVIVDRAVPFLESSAREGKPFFAIVWFHTPHLPVVCGPQQAKMYAVYDSYKKNYYGCITAMDEQVGRLRATLKRLGVSDNTLLAFCSDNGPEGNASAPGSAGPFRGRKRDLYEGGIRVPGVIEWPGHIQPGAITDIPTVTSDYLPTIAEIVDAEIPDKRPIDGISLLKVFSGEMKLRPSPIGFNFSGRQAFSDNRFKLVYYPTRKGKNTDSKESKNSTASNYQLYDLLKDPSEQEDLASKHPDVVNSMAAAMKQWMASCEQSSQGRDYPN